MDAAPETCARKAGLYPDPGVDRLMYLAQCGALAHSSVLRSLEHVGTHWIPRFERRRIAV